MEDRCNKTLSTYLRDHVISNVTRSRSEKTLEISKKARLPWQETRFRKQTGFTGPRPGQMNSLTMFLSSSWRPEDSTGSGAESA